MAITVKQWLRGTKEVRRSYNRAVIAAMRAGLNIANRRAKYFYIKDRVGPPLRRFLTKRSGALRDSIKMMQPKFQGKRWIMGLRAGSAAVRYAAHETGIRGKKRPYMRPALRDAQPQMNKQIAIAIETLYRTHLR